MRPGNIQSRDFEHSGRSLRLQINTDIYVLHRHHLVRLVERYPTIRNQIMVIAEHRHRIAKARETYFSAARGAPNLASTSARSRADTDVALARE